MGYKIALLPGDGVGIDVLEAAKGVLDAVGFEAEYTYADIGWEFWCKEGNPLPERNCESNGKHSSARGQRPRTNSSAAADARSCAGTRTSAASSAKDTSPRRPCRAA